MKNGKYMEMHTVYIMISYYHFLFGVNKFNAHYLLTRRTCHWKWSLPVVFSPYELIRWNISILLYYYSSTHFRGNFDTIQTFPAPPLQLQEPAYHLIRSNNEKMHAARFLSMNERSWYVAQLNVWDGCTMYVAFNETGLGILTQQGWKMFIYHIIVLEPITRRRRKDFKPSPNLSRSLIWTTPPKSHNFWICAKIRNHMDPTSFEIVTNIRFWYHL